MPLPRLVTPWVRHCDCVLHNALLVAARQKESNDCVSAFYTSAQPRVAGVCSRTQVPPGGMRTLPGPDRAPDVLGAKQAAPRLCGKRQHG